MILYAGDVRRPPRPPFEARSRSERICPMCGETPSGSRRRRWHAECAEMWHYVAFPQIAIELLVRAHGDRCWACRKTRAERIAEQHARVEAGLQPYARPTALELEHVRPLWSLMPAERLELKWWLPFNLQLLCRECHLAKSAREARERYALQNPEGSLARRMRIQQHGYDPLDPNPQLWREAAS